MTKVHGSKADVYGNGYVLSDFLNSAAWNGSRDTAESTTFKKKSKTYVPGLKDTQMALGGIWDGDQDAVDEVLWASFNANATGLFSYIPQGNETVGNLVFSMDSIQSSYDVTSDLGNVCQITAQLNAGDNGYISRGKVLHPMAVEAAGGNSASLDNTAQSTFGGSLVVHATAAANLVVTLQDSADNVTFADLPGSLTFAARGSQRLYVPGTIRRYTRVLWTGTGTFFAEVNRFLS